PALELVHEPRHRLVRAQVAPRALPNRGRLEPVRAAEHRARKREHGVERRGSAAQKLEGRERLAVAEADRLLLDALGALHGSTAQAALEVVDVGPREAGVRRAQERVQIAAAALLPREAKQREQSPAERRLVDAQ